MLRVATLLANDQLYRQENRSQYSSLVEFTALYRYNNQLAWLQSGQPQIFLKRKKQNLIPLSICYQEDQGFTQKDSGLPFVGLGLESSCSFQVGECLIHPEDQVLLFSGHQWPTELLGKTEDLKFDQVAKSLANQHKDQPFWFCIIDL